MKEVLLLNSGGLDSRALAKYLKDQGFIVTSLHIVFNSNIRDAQRIAASGTAALYCDSHHEWTLDTAGQETTTTHNGFVWPVPALAGLCIYIGTLYARINNITEVYLGLKGNIFPPEREAAESELTSINLANWLPEIILPFKSMTTYEEILSFVPNVNILGVHSCPVSNIPCGACGKCLAIAAL